MARFKGTNRTPRHGQYEIDGVRYPRVTTILGLVSKPGLEAWRLRMGADEANRLSQEAAAFGTALHRACEEIDSGLPWSGAPDLQPLVDAYCAWREREVWRVLATERLVYHERWRYAGTLDRLYLLRDGRRALVDFKTGNTVDGLTRLQLTAYDCALGAMGEDRADVRLVLHLPRTRPGELAVIDYDDDERDERAWRRCLGLWKWWQRHHRDWEATR